MLSPTSAAIGERPIGDNPCGHDLGGLPRTTVLAVRGGWESPSAAEEFRSVVRSVVGDHGVTDGMLAAWVTENPPLGAPRRRRAAVPRA